MTRANPASLRRSLEMAHALAKAGVDFVCMPVADEADRVNLATQASDRMERMTIIAESVERAK